MRRTLEPLIAGILLALVSVQAALVALDLNPFADLDARTYDWFVAHRTPALTTALTFVTRCFDPLVVPFLAAAAAGTIVLVRRDPRGALTVVLGLSAASAVTQVVKLAVGRARPPDATQLVSAEQNVSFPSGHSNSSAALLVLVALVLTSGAATAARAAAVSLALLLAGCVAVSRLYLGVHYVSDVVAGLLLGTAVALLATFIARRTSPRPHPQPVATH